MAKGKILTVVAACAVVLLTCGCERPAYYRKDFGRVHVAPANPSSPMVTHSIWFQRHKTTFHGICANVVGDGSNWELDLPSAQINGETVTQGYPSFATAERVAEARCPTKAGAR